MKPITLTRVNKTTVNAIKRAIQNDESYDRVLADNSHYVQANYAYTDDAVAQWREDCIALALLEVDADKAQHKTDQTTRNALASAIAQTDYPQIQIGSTIYNLNMVRSSVNMFYEAAHKDGLCAQCVEKDFPGWCRWENALKAAAEIQEAILWRSDPPLWTQGE